MVSAWRKAALPVTLMPQPYAFEIAAISSNRTALRGKQPLG
jgi:hypothetical protein